MKTSKETNEIYVAIVEAQDGLTNPKKNKTVKVKTQTGKEYSYSYADLGLIIEDSKPVLKKNKLAIIQGTEIASDGVIITTRLIHASGQWIQSKIKMNTKGDGRMNDNQTMGSSITYGRRYAISAMLNISADDDDDGQAGVTTDIKRTEGPAREPVKESLARSPDDPDNEWNKTTCQKCGGRMAISQTGNPYCTNKCWLPEGKHFIDEFNNLKAKE